MSGSSSSSSVKDGRLLECPRRPGVDDPEEPPGGVVQTEDGGGRCSSEAPPPPAAEDGGKVEAGASDALISRQMEEEEQQLMEEGERKERELMEQARRSRDPDCGELRFRRLQHLLQKSNVYAKFLLTRMEQQQSQEKAKKEKEDQKKKKKEEEEEINNKQRTEERAGRKRRRKENFRIADVMSKEEILSHAKKARVEDEDAAAGRRQLEAEDVEQMRESNQDIRRRVAAAVRDGAGRRMDPSRRVDGQPVPALQPLLFTGGVMRWYQVEGLEWLRMLWENGINGVLADEMGLGKTVQCVALVALMLQRGVEGPFLVVAPLSTLSNWRREFQRFTPEVSVLLYHGPQSERVKLLPQISRAQGTLRMFPVVLTSFEICMIDRRFLQRHQWKYLMVDEGHRIKNARCRLVRQLQALRSDNKLLLTGTPLQNSLAELWALLHFLLPDVFDDLRSFESWFDVDSLGDAETVVAAEREQNVLSMLHQILTPFLLRRLKSDVALEVPPKKEVVVFAPLTAKQDAFYRAVVERTISSLLRPPQEEPAVSLSSHGRPRRRGRRQVNYSETPGDDLEKHLERVSREMEQSPSPVPDVWTPLDAQINLKLRNVFMLLKRCCNHPYLLEQPLDASSQDAKIDEQLVKTSGKFLLLDRLLPALKERGHKVLIFSQMTSILDLLEDFCVLRSFRFSRLDGSMSLREREDNISSFSSDPEVFMFLLSTRAGGLGLNLTAADTVIIFDSDWNPQADLQAQDRCHRIGQRRPVLVLRLVASDTVDQRILERAEAKRRLERMVIPRDKFKGAKAELKQGRSCIDLEELKELLQGGGAERRLTGCRGKVISDEDLEALLDRSDLLDKKKSGVKEKGGVFRLVEAESADISLS